jgi:C4-dicarboxylate transporter, DctM subunit
LGTSALFGAISGSSLAGSLAYLEMRAVGYKTKIAAGVISVGSTLDMLIPPGMAFVIIGIMAQLSIGRLFVAA